MFLLLRASRYYNSAIPHELHLGSTSGDWYCSHLRDKSCFMCREFKWLLSDHPQAVNGRVGCDIFWFPASCLSFLTLSTPTAMALWGSFRALTGKSWLLDLPPTPVASDMGCYPTLLQAQAYTSIASCYAHHHYSSCVQCYPEPNLPSAGVDCFTNLYMLVWKTKLKRENTQYIEIRKSNSETVYSF